MAIINQIYPRLKFYFPLILIMCMYGKAFKEREKNREIKPGPHSRENLLSVPVLLQETSLERNKA